MDPTMDNTKHILNYLMPIIDQVNPEVHDFMQRYADVPWLCPTSLTFLYLGPFAPACPQHHGGFL